MGSPHAKHGKPVSLHVKPFKITHLCFEVDGIVDKSNVELGQQVTAYDLSTLYAALRSGKTTLGDDSRLVYDAETIERAFPAPPLVILRNEIRKTALNQAINARQNAYFSKYGHITDISALMNLYYSPSVAHSKPNRLASLAVLSADQANQLKMAYTADKRLGVVKNTVSTVDSATRSIDSSVASGRLDHVGAGFTSEDRILPAPPEHANWGNFHFNDDNPMGLSIDESSNEEKTSVLGSAHEFQAIMNTDYGYRIPYLESQAQDHRAQISLMDERFVQFMSALHLPHIQQVLKNELESIDRDIYKLQVALVDTNLISPIDGVVTGIYKYPGDAVHSGEPVVRVEDSNTILILATLVYRGPIAIGTHLTIETHLFDSPKSKKLVGTAVSVRGHTDDESWEVIIKANNLDTKGKTILPIGYRFDYDDT